MEIVNNRFELSNGVNPLELVEKYGSPLYVYDSAIMKRQFDRLKNAFDVKKLKINYACKASTNINILKYFKQLGAGLDTVSIQEVMLGLKAGYKPEDIIYTPNCVSLEEIEMAVERGVKINIDNISILSNLDKRTTTFRFAFASIRISWQEVVPRFLLDILTPNLGFLFTKCHMFCELPKLLI